MSNKELASRYVFIDTSAYQSKNFQFGQHALGKLEEFLEDEELTLIVTDITIKEVEKHLREKAFEAARLVKKIKKEAMFLRNTSDLPCYGIFEDISGDVVYDIVYEKFHSLLKIGNVENVSINSIKPSIVFDKYFSEKPPFGGKNKKCEFPDAFVLEAVNQASLKMSQLIYVVSSDPDMKNYCDCFDNLTHLESVDDLIDLTIRNAENLKEPVKFADQVYSYLETNITDQIKEQLLAGEFEYEDLDAWNDEELTDVTVDNFAVKSTKIVDVSKSYATYEVEVEVVLTASYSISDYDRSPWDPEDKACVFVFTNDITKEHTETYGFSVTLEYLDGIKKNSKVFEVYYEYMAFALSDSNSKIISVSENYLED